MKRYLPLVLGVVLVLAGLATAAIGTGLVDVKTLSLHGASSASGGCACGAATGSADAKGAVPACSCGQAGEESAASSEKLEGTESQSCSDSCSGGPANASAASPKSAAAGTLDGDPLKSCGVLSLYQVCRALGVKTSPAELVKLSHADAKSVTMLGLAEAARAKGLKAAGMKLTYEDLRQSSKPLIAWLHEGHFVAVRDASPKAVKVYDNVQGEITLPRAEFEKRWSGEVLLIEKGGRK